MIRFTIPGCPSTKKNSQQIAVNRKTGRRFPIQSKQYLAYEASAGYFIPCKHLGIEDPVQVKCLYYMPDHRRIDLLNLLAATDDILVKYGVLKDDNCKIVQSHDGSRVLYDKENPRVEIEICEIEGDFGWQKRKGQENLLV